MFSLAFRRFSKYSYLNDKLKIILHKIKRLGDSDS